MEIKRQHAQNFQWIQNSIFLYGKHFFNLFTNSWTLIEWKISCIMLSSNWYQPFIRKLKCQPFPFIGLLPIFAIFLWYSCKKIKIYSHLQDDCITSKPEKVILVVIAFMSTISIYTYIYIHTYYNYVIIIIYIIIYVNIYIYIYIYILGIIHCLAISIWFYHPTVFEVIEKNE